MFEVSDLRYKYPTGKEDVIRGISFGFEQGEIFGFLGPSGAGKSTTQKLMIGILKGFRGKVRYRGKDLGSYGREIYRDIGVGFEAFGAPLTAMVVNCLASNKIEGFAIEGPKHPGHFADRRSSASCIACVVKNTVPPAFRYSRTTSLTVFKRRV
jgi:energy-coupling factor transporter ATP-binding protein EcfA2